MKYIKRKNTSKQQLKKSFIIFSDSSPSENGKSFMFGFLKFHVIFIYILLFCLFACLYQMAEPTGHMTAGRS